MFFMKGKKILSIGVHQATTRLFSWMGVIEESWVTVLLGEFVRAV